MVILLMIGVLIYIVFGWTFYVVSWKNDKRIYYHYIYIWFMVFGVVVIPLWVLENVHKLLSKEV